MASEYHTYHITPNFQNQPAHTRRSWLDTSFESSKPCAIVQPAPFTPIVHRSETSSSPSKTHYSESFPHGPAFGHSPQDGNQSVAYPESSQRTYMDDTPYLPVYEARARPTDIPPRAAASSGGFDPARVTRMNFDEAASGHLIASASPSNQFTRRRDAYPNMHQPNISEASLAPHPYVDFSSHPPAHDLRLIPDSMLAEFTLSSTPSSTPTSALGSPISPHPDKTSLRPSMLTLQMHSLEVVNDPDNHATLSSFLKLSGDIPTYQHGQTFSTPIEPVSTTNEAPPRWARHPRDDVTIGKRYKHASRSESSLSSPSCSTPESDYHSSFPNGVGARGRTSNPTSTSPATGPRKNKMHRCEVCDKLFPRPSGLATHMNSHNGTKPFHCPLPECHKAFTVRSNAKRHLRTHGVNNLPPHPHVVSPTFTVGFEAPLVAHNYGSGGVLPKLKWVEQSLTTRTAMEWPDSPSGSDETDGGPVPASPLSAVHPSGYVFGHEQGYANTPSPYYQSQAGSSIDERR